MGRLDLEKYKATIKGLTTIRRPPPGNRSQPRGRRLDRSAAQELRLRECLADQVPATSPANAQRPSGPTIARDAETSVGGGALPRGTRPHRREHRSHAAAGREAARPQFPTRPGRGARRGVLHQGRRHASRRKCISSARTWTATDGARRRMMTARAPRWSWNWRGLFRRPDVKTERSIRFVPLEQRRNRAEWRLGLRDQRAALQGKEEPAGSGRYPEPKWLGMIQHDMMLFDHGMPRADGSVPKEQRPEADVNIEFQSLAKEADGAQKLAWDFLRGERSLCHRLSRGRGAAHDQHRQHAFHGSRARRSACARTSADVKSAPAGIRSGINRRMSMPPTPMPTFAWD